MLNLDPIVDSFVPQMQEIRVESGENGIIEIQDYIKSRNAKLSKETK